MPRALLAGRHYFTHEDVQSVALSVLGHRLIIKPEAEVEGKTTAAPERYLDFSYYDRAMQMVGR